MPDRPWNRSGTGDREEPVYLSDWLRSLRERYGRYVPSSVAVAALVLGLAAVVGAGWFAWHAFVGIGCIQTGPPVADFDHEYRDSKLTIRHDGGDTYDGGMVERVEFLVDGRRVASPLLPFEAGDRVTVHDVPPGSRVRIVAVLSDDYAESACTSKRKSIVAFTV
jgi:hypothetical protein